jgi:hypothetical protein
MIQLAVICISKDDDIGRVSTYRSVLAHYHTALLCNLSLIFVSIEHGMVPINALLEPSERLVPIVEVLGKDSGIYNAMNIGIRNATSDFITFLNAGDLMSSLLEPGTLGLDLLHAKACNSPIIATNWHLTNTLGSKRLFRSLSFKSLLLPLPLISHQALIYRTAMIKPFAETQNFLSADHLQWLQTLNGSNLYKSNTILAEVDRVGVSNEKPTATILQKVAAILIYKPELGTLIGSSILAILFLTLYTPYLYLKKILPAFANRK